MKKKQRNVVAAAPLVLVAVVALACASTAGEETCGRAVVLVVYVLGDSLVDIGNNNFLPPPAPRASPPCGIDLPGRRTGRFTNGYNLADIIAQHEPTSLPLLDTTNERPPPERPNWGQLCFRWLRHSRHHCIMALVWLSLASSGQVHKTGEKGGVQGMEEVRFSFQSAPFRLVPALRRVGAMETAQRRTTQGSGGGQPGGDSSATNADGVSYMVSNGCRRRSNCSLSWTMGTAVLSWQAS